MPHLIAAQAPATLVRVKATPNPGPNPTPDPNPNANPNPNQVSLTWSLRKHEPPVARWSAPSYGGRRLSGRPGSYMADATGGSVAGAEVTQGVEQLLTGAEDGALEWAWRPADLSGEEVGDALSP